MCVLQSQAFSSSLQKHCKPVPNDLLHETPQPAANNDDDNESEMDDYFDDV